MEKKASAVYFSWEGIMRGVISFGVLHYLEIQNRFSSLKYLMYRKRGGWFSSPVLERIGSIQKEAVKNGKTDAQIMDEVYEVFNQQIRGMEPKELEEWFAEYAEKAKAWADLDILECASDLHSKSKLVVIGPAPFYRGEIEAVLKANMYDGQFPVIANDHDIGLADRRTVRGIRADINNGETRLHALRADIKSRTIWVAGEKVPLNPTYIVYVGGCRGDIKCMGYIAENGGTAIVSPLVIPELKHAAERGIKKRLVVPADFKDFSRILTELTD